jgi:hypothetical protein
VRVPGGLVFLIASVAATLALIIGGYLLGPIRWSANIFRTPIPYALLLLCFFIVNPAYLLLRSLLRLSLARFLLVALGLGLLLFVWQGYRWGWHPEFLLPRNLLWLFGLPVVGALAYWGVLRVLAPEFGDN